MKGTVDAMARKSASLGVLHGCNTTPPMGPPTTANHEGNSAPARTLVDGLGKSERSGERREAK